jgi:hypothetical protein
MRQAARNRWGVPDELQTEAIFQVQQILSSSDDDRSRLSAVKLLVEMIKVDQKDEIEAAKVKTSDVSVFQAVADAKAENERLDRERLARDL